MAIGICAVVALGAGLSNRGMRSSMKTVVRAFVQPAILRAYAAMIAYVARGRRGAGYASFFCVSVRSIAWRTYEEVDDAKDSAGSTGASGSRTDEIFCDEVDSCGSP
jgi:hypothetical protein